MSFTSKRGFLLYIVIAVMFALAIMAFALNSLKRGAVTQLAKNVDQNRLSLLAQSANAEVLSMIRSKVNSDPDSQIFEKFRSVFPSATAAMPPLRQPVVLFSNFQPQQTLSMAVNDGYNLKIKSKAVLTAFRESPYNSVTAFNGYLDVYSQAYREGFEENLIEAHERRDVRLVDLRHNLDKYALFVKNYCPDYNNPRRRIVVEGIPGSGAHISHAYIGNGNYPDCSDPDKSLWFDVCTSELPGFPGFNTISGYSNTLKKFPGSSMAECLYSVNTLPFSNFSELPISLFYKVQAVIKIYEMFVSQAAAGCLGETTVVTLSKGPLVEKCRRGMSAADSNSAAYEICKDFVDNYRDSGGGDYSRCSGFQKIITTCAQEWKYIYGYTDANSIWKVENVTAGGTAAPRDWATALAFRGLSAMTEKFRNKGPFVSENLDRKDSKIFNPERPRVGKMAKIYGESGDKKILVEGPVYLRYFKIGFLDEFKKTIDFYRAQKEINPEPVPLSFHRYDKEPKSFLNTRLGSSVPAGMISERYLMSRAVDSVPINGLLGNSVQYFDGDGREVTMNPYSTSPNFDKPIQKTGSSVPGSRFGRLIDFKTVSWNYPSPQQFLMDRVSNETLFVDGVMYIEKGDLDLSGVKQFYGKGMIYLGSGNCYIGSLKRYNERDHLRLYLRSGDFSIKSSADSVEIQASLSAFFYPFSKKSQTQQGSLLLNGKKEVKIVGNLLVDYLYTSSGGVGLADGGVLKICHDPIIYDPAANLDGEDLDPYHISIGPVKTLFSINAGGKTF